MNLTPPRLAEPNLPDWICDSYQHWTGRELVPPGAERARDLYLLPSVVVAHDLREDPIFQYGNRAALDLFEMSWDAFVHLPSRLSAEAPLRDEREAMLEQVRTQGYSDSYRGTRISASGRRFHIEHATVWTLLDAEGHIRGQAATFPMPPIQNAD